MKAASLFVAGLAVASLSIAPAHAQSKPVAPASTESKCSTTTWPVISSVQCTIPRAKNYVECGEMVRKNGGTGMESQWWCSNQGFKS
jgi:hypothetical protein